MYKAPLPPGQPRSLRSIAERNAPAKAFPEPAAYDYQAGVPADVAGAGQKYKDKAAEQLPAPQEQPRGRRSIK